jgi:hypothetical protein
MAKKKSGAKKAGGAKKTGSSKKGPRPRPKLTAAFQKKMKTLRDDLKVIIATGVDQKGTLSKGQMNKATRMHDALEQATQEVFCGQTLVAY